MSPLVTYSLLFCLLVLACWFVYHIRRDPRANPLDLITTPETGRLSAAKIGQLVGVVVSSWVVIGMTKAGTLTFDVLFVYLAYTAGVDLFGKYLRYKSNTPPAVAPADEPTPEKKEGE